MANKSFSLSEADWFKLQDLIAHSDASRGDKTKIMEHLWSKGQPVEEGKKGVGTRRKSVRKQ